MTTMNILAQVFCKHMLSLFLGKYLRVVFLIHSVIVINFIDPCLNL